MLILTLSKLITGLYLQKEFGKTCSQQKVNSELMLHMKSYVMKVEGQLCKPNIYRGVARDSGCQRQRFIVFDGEKGKIFLILATSF